MDFDFTWQALVQPGLSEQYFNLKDVKELDVHTEEFSIINAWWMSEFSRLIYRRGKDESGDYPAREDILTSMGFLELGTFRRGSNFCAIIVSKRDSRSPFAVLVFRGTSGVDGWLSNFNLIQSSWSEGGWVHAGFKWDFLQIWDEIDAVLSRIDMPIFYTGHSLGGALATLAASKRPPKAVYSFGAPKVGDGMFADSLSGVKLHRVVNHRDIVATIPPSRLPFVYCHAGEEHLLRFGCSCSSRVPRFLSDHAPVNYTAGLERLIQTFS